MGEEYKARRDVISFENATDIMKVLDYIANNYRHSEYGRRAVMQKKSVRTMYRQEVRKNRGQLDAARKKITAFNHDNNTAQSTYDQLVRFYGVIESGFVTGHNLSPHSGVTRLLNQRGEGYVPSETVYTTAVRVLRGQKDNLDRTTGTARTKHAAATTAVNTVHLGKETLSLPQLPSYEFADDVSAVIVRVENALQVMTGIEGRLEQLREYNKGVSSVCLELEKGSFSRQDVPYLPDGILETVEAALAKLPSEYRLFTQQLESSTTQPVRNTTTTLQAAYDKGVRVLSQKALDFLRESYQIGNVDNLSRDVDAIRAVQTGIENARTYQGVAPVHVITDEQVTQLGELRRALSDTQAYITAFDARRNSRTTLNYSLDDLTAKIDAAEGDFRSNPTVDSTNAGYVRNAKHVYEGLLAQKANSGNGTGALPQKPVHQAVDSLLRRYNESTLPSSDSSGTITIPEALKGRLDRLVQTVTASNYASVLNEPAQRQSGSW